MVQPCSPIRPRRCSSAGVNALQSQFRASAYWSIRQLVCELDREQIVLRGTVPSYYLKQVAQSLAVKAVGTERLHSDIEVQPEERPYFGIDESQTGEIVLTNENGVIAMLVLSRKQNERLIIDGEHRCFNCWVSGGTGCAFGIEAPGTFVRFDARSFVAALRNMNANRLS